MTNTIPAELFRPISEYTPNGDDELLVFDGHCFYAVTVWEDMPADLTYYNGDVHVKPLKFCRLPKVGDMK